MAMKKDLHQIGKTNLKKDKMYAAMPPGMRISERGNVYYERRKNRSDISKKKKI